MALSKITTESLLDGEITLPKLSSGTDGNIISYDASGNPVAIATGNDGQVLTSTGAGSPPAFETPAGGGAWTLINTAVASSSSSLTITGLDTTYDKYAVSFTDIKPATDEVYGIVRLGDSGGIDSGGTDYAWNMGMPETTAYGWSANFSDGADYLKIGHQVGNSTGEALSGLYYIARGSSTAYPMVHGTFGCITNGGSGRGGPMYGYRKAVITLTQVLFQFSSGNIASGRMSVWGIAHA